MGETVNEAARQAGSIMFELRGQALLAGLTGELAAVRHLLQKFGEGFDTGFAAGSGFT